MHLVWEGVCIWSGRGCASGLGSVHPLHTPLHTQPLHTQPLHIRPFVHVHLHTHPCTYASATTFPLAIITRTTPLHTPSTHHTPADSPHTHTHPVDRQTLVKTLPSTSMSLCNKPKFNMLNLLN